jgi:hypothetical protein
MDPGIFGEKEKRIERWLEKNTCFQRERYMAQTRKKYKEKIIFGDGLKNIGIDDMDNGSACALRWKQHTTTAV